MDVRIARIGKPHGIRGEVSVQVLTDEPETRLGVGEQLQCEPAERGPLRIARARWNKNIMLLSFEGISTRNQAEELRGTTLISEATDEDDAWYEEDLLGFTVLNHGQDVGTVAGLQLGAAQDLLKVELTSGAIALVPFVTEIVTDVDSDAQQVLIQAPAGLLELGE